MAAAKSKFEEVLDYITDSKLNFFIQRTPFSAQISLKKSFAVYFKDTKNSENDISERFNHQDRIVEPKYETIGSVEIIQNLKATIEEKSKEVEELKMTRKNWRLNLKHLKEKLRRTARDPKS